jgi:hypothetical protein
MDFTLTLYKNLLESLKSAGYSFVTFHDFLASITQSIHLPAGRQDNQSINQSPDSPDIPIVIGNRDRGNQSIDPQPQPQPILILRHDVDLKPQNSLATAKIEHKMGIKGSYYFRMVPESYNVDIIKEIANLGHEIGYHYETMDTAVSRHCERNLRSQPRTKDELGEANLYLSDCFAPQKYCGSRNDEMRIDEAYKQFCENLEAMRRVADIKTICMHGSPRSRYDNRDIWTKYSYRDLGIVGEPYFDIDFNDFFYLTDTGRRWDGHRVSVRDKMPQQERWASDGLTFRSTKDIVTTANKKLLPNRIMITVHPQRWSDSFFSWTKEFVLQNLKNVVKRVMISGIIRR